MAEKEKLKILYLMRILLEETDENHILNAVELCDILDRRYGISCNRKTIYGDIARLQEFGLDIRQQKGSVPGYWIGSREFSLPELKLLVDAVQASRFITVKKTEELIRKLEKLTSRENASRLQRQVFIYNRPKAGNETIYANVDRIHEAIQDNRQIAFRYCEWTPQKQLRQKKNGARYQVSPWSLTWDNENYYLVAYEAGSDQIRHYRVDKMQQIEACGDVRQGRERFEGFDLAAFAKKTFGMYGGEDASVTLLCDNSLAGVVLDRFGTDILLVPAGANRFRAHVLVSVSRQFFGWVTGIGEQMQITAPEHVRKAYLDYLKGIQNSYVN